MGKFINFILGTNQSVGQAANTHQVSAYKKAQRERELIRHESKIGAIAAGYSPAFPARVIGGVGSRRIGVLAGA